MRHKILVLIIIACFSTFLSRAQRVDSATSPTDSVTIPTIMVEDANVSAEDDGGAAQDASTITMISRDPFVLTAMNVFIYGFFNPRGYYRNGRDVEVNGVSINDGETGNAAFNQIGGLNDVLRGRDITWGLNPSAYSFGGIAGSTYMHGTAADQPKQTKVSYASSDQVYRNRVMFTESTGLMRNGWAFSFSGNKRWAEQGYRPGTNYDGYSYYGAASKRLGRGMLNLTTYGSPTKQAKASYATEEVFSLDNNKYYNQYWGYQDGVVRSSRIQNIYQPTTVLNYEYKPNVSTTWNTALGYEFGKDKTSFIDYYNAQDPYGDYYRKLPSYLLTLGVPGAAPSSQVLAAYNQLRDTIIANRNLLQIQWNDLYQANYLNVRSIQNANGISGNTVTGKEASYVIANDVQNVKKYSLNSTVVHDVNSHLELNGGVTGTLQQTEYYKELADLMGGDFFVDYNQFAAQSNLSNPNYLYNNLKNPNQIVKTGDKYGYDYAISHYNAFAWGQALMHYGKLSFFAAGKAGEAGFQRDGFMQNGVFPNNSFGTSPMHSFFNYAIKGGALYNIDKHNALFANFGYYVQPPTVDNTYISVRTRDFTVNNPGVYNMPTMEFGYAYKSKLVNARILGYATETNNVTEIKRFYNDDPTYLTFVNYVMQGENIQSIGGEGFIEVRAIEHLLKITAVASVGQVYYSNNPTISVYEDNDPTQHATAAQTYIKNYYVGGGPQSAYTLGLDITPKRDFWIQINMNYYDRNYVSINPNRRTLLAGALVDRGSALWNEIYGQEKLPSAFTMDLRTGYTFQLARMSDVMNRVSPRSKLTLSAGVFNMLNNTDIINSGFEQLRYNFSLRDPNEFPNKYAYALGINFNLSATLTF